MTEPTVHEDPAPSRGARTVGWLELFYDLVFVGAIVTLSDAVSEHPDGDVLVEVTAAFAALWWIWLTTTLFANRYRVDDALQRALVLVQMLLLTVIALLVGDGVGKHEGSASLAYALLCVCVAVMHGRSAHRPGALGALALARRNEYAIAALPLAAAAFVSDPARYVLWVIGLATIAVPAIAYRFGREQGEAPLREEHLIERMGLLTIIVCGESFVKVSLVASRGRLETLDEIVLCALFVLVFSMWWSYFDDIPEARFPEALNRMRGWFVAHLTLQVCLVGVAVGYAKLLRLDLGDFVDFDKMLIAVGPLIGVYLSLALLGTCTRRTPAGPLLALRLGSAVALVPIGILIWKIDWVDVEVTAVLLAAFAMAHAALASVLRRHTHVAALPGHTRTL